MHFISKKQGFLRARNGRETRFEARRAARPTDEKKRPSSPATAEVNRGILTTDYTDSTDEGGSWNEDGSNCEGLQKIAPSRTPAKMTLSGMTDVELNMKLERPKARKPWSDRWVEVGHLSGGGQGIP